MLMVQVISRFVDGRKGSCCTVKIQNLYVAGWQMQMPVFPVLNYLKKSIELLGHHFCLGDLRTPV